MGVAVARAKPKGEIVLAGGGAGRDAEDVRLLEQIVAGDSRALAMLMRRHGPQLAAVAFAITRSRETAHEVVQDVFVRVWEQRAALDPNGGIGGFLWRATRNRAVSALRRARLDTRTLQAAVERAALESPRVAHNAGAQALDAEAAVAEITAVVATLPPRCREIFLLKLRHQLSSEEIAEALGISVATTRNQLSRAMRRLAEHFGQR